MAGRGPAPKDPEQRRRTNAPARGDWVEIKAPAKPVVPPLSKIGAAPDGGWPARTKALWESIRKDPASTTWGPAEHAAAVELIYLHAEWTVFGPASLAAEIRLRSDGLGLTLKGKRDLRLRVVEEVAVEQPRRSRGGKTPARDYGHLRPVL
jgi:hypothetical protein